MMNDEIITVSDNFFQLDNCKGSYFTSFSIHGNSKQTVTTGAQLLNPLKMPVSATVKGITFNLNGDGTYTVKGTSTADFAFIAISYLLEPGPYYISGGSVDTVHAKVIVTHSDGTSSHNYNRPFVILASDTRISFVIQVEKAGTMVNKTIYPMLNTGSTAKPWEPYAEGRTTPSMEHPQEITNTGKNGNIDVAVTTQIGMEPYPPIPGQETYEYQRITIPVSLSLCGMGDVHDKITCRDGIWGIERMFVEINFDGSETWMRESTDDTDKKRFKNQDYTSLIKAEASFGSPIKIMCNRLRGGSSENTYHLVECISSNVSGMVYIYLDAFASGDLTAFKAYLSTHPIKVIFERSVPLWEPLHSSTQSALKSLHTYTPNTRIFNSAKAAMKVGYRKYKSEP